MKIRLLLLSLALLNFGAFAQTTVVGNGLTYSNGNVTIGTTVLDPVTGATDPKPALLPAWRLAVGSVRDGASDARLLFIGDSVSDGIGGSTAATVPVYSAYTWRLYQLLNSHVVPAAPGLAFAKTAFSPTTPDTRWAYGTGWASAWNGYGFGNAIAGTAPSGALVFTPGGSISYDSFDVYYLGSPGNAATLSFTATGGVATPGTLNQAAGIYKTTVTAGSAATTNAVTITGTGNSVVIAVEPFLSTSKQVRLGICAQPGIQAADLVARDATYGVQAALAAYQPKLVVLELGVNDADHSRTPAQFQNDMGTLISWAQAAGANVVLMTPVPAQDSALLAKEAAYLPVFSALAKQYKVPIIDIFTRFGAAYTASWMTDDKHPNNAGHWDVAGAIAAFLHSVSG